MKTAASLEYLKVVDLEQQQAGVTDASSAAVKAACWETESAVQLDAVLDFSKVGKKAVDLVFSEVASMAV
jgi:hypothetical protein